MPTQLTWQGPRLPERIYRHGDFPYANEGQTIPRGRRAHIVQLETAKRLFAAVRPRQVVPLLDVLSRRSGPPELSSLTHPSSAGTIVVQRPAESWLISRGNSRRFTPKVRLQAPSGSTMRSRQWDSPSKSRDRPATRMEPLAVGGRSLRAAGAHRKSASGRRRASAPSDRRGSPSIPDSEAAERGSAALKAGITSARLFQPF
jgi:hypothetical protein